MHITPFQSNYRSRIRKFMFTSTELTLFVVGLPGSDVTMAWHMSEKHIVRVHRWILLSPKGNGLYNRHKHHVNRYN